MSSYREEFERWMDSPALSEEEWSELNAIAEDDKEIKERFFAPLEFGTAGLRGTMKTGLHNMNIHITRHATQAFADIICAEGEEAKWARHTRVFNAINEGLDELGFRQVIKPELRAGLVSSAIYPDDPNWSFEKVHDYCYERGFTIYPGKISTTNTFRLCALGAIDEADIKDFFVVFKEALINTGVKIPVQYN